MSHWDTASPVPGLSGCEGGAKADPYPPRNLPKAVPSLPSILGPFALFFPLLLASLSAGCTSTLDHGKTKALPPSALSEDARFVQTGRVSYYSKVFINKKTASGERYDPDAFTAAHRSLPFGTLLLVKARGKGRFVIVRVNDRGPFVGGRVLDLSTAAARKLGIMTRGVADADVYVVDPRSRLASKL